MARRTYGRKCLRNFLLAALAALLLWIAAGYPLPREMDFRRMERQRLLERSEILLEIEGTQTGDRDFIVGAATDRVYAAKLGKGSNTLTVWEKTPGEATLVPLPGDTRYWNKGSYLGPSFVAVDPPVKAVSAQLTVRLDFRGEINDRPVEWAEDYTVEGEWRGSCLFFQLVSRYEHDRMDLAALAEQNRMDDLTRLGTSRFELPPYTLTFFDGAGNVISTQCGGKT